MLLLLLAVDSVELYQHSLKLEMERTNG